MQAIKSILSVIGIIAAVVLGYILAITIGKLFLKLFAFLISLCIGWAIVAALVVFAIFLVAALKVK